MAVLHGLWAIWSLVISYTVATSAATFFLAGLAASAIHARSWPVRWLALTPPLSGLLGALLAFLFGAVPSFLVAAAYRATPAGMTPFPAAAIWGVSLGAFIVALHSAVFDKIL